jgi:uncharacterized protein YukE
MPIDASIALSGKPVQFENPLNYLAQAQQIQQLQNQNALAPVEMQMRQLQMQRAQAQYNALAHLYDPDTQPGPQAPGAALPALSSTPQASVPGINALAQPADAQAGATPQNALAGGSALGPATMLRRLNALAASGVDTKQLFDQYKFGIEGGQMNPGYRLNPTTGQMEYLADPTKGFTIDPHTGQVSALPGYAAADASIKGAETKATTEATNAATAPDAALQMPDGRGGMMAVPGASKAAQLAYMQGQSAPAAPKGPRFVGADLLDQLPPAQAAALRDQIAKSGGKASINLNTPDGVHVQGDVDMSRAAGGYTPPSVGQDGHPIPPTLQTTLQQIADSRDPAKLDALAQQMTAKINAMPESPQKQAALQNVAAEVQKITQYWQGSAQPGQPAQPAQGQGFSLASPNDVALDKERREAALKLQTAPQQALKEKEYSNMADYTNSLNGRLSDSQALLQRIDQSRKALAKFSAGGGADTRVKLAQLMQGIPGVPSSVVDKVAGGDLSAAQEFQKYAAQEALETMRQSLASDSGKGSQGNRVSMDLFIKNNPNLETDPRAIEKIFNFLTQQHNQLLDESKTYQQYKAAPSNDPTQFPNYWAQEMIKRGYVQPEIKSGYAKGIATPTNIQALLDKYK